MTKNNLYNKFSERLLTEEEIDDLVREMLNLPRIEDNSKLVTRYDAIDFDDLIDTIRSLKKMPTYDILLKENKKLKEQLKKSSEVEQAVINKLKEILSILEGYYDEKDRQNL